MVNDIKNRFTAPIIINPKSGFRRKNDRDTIVLTAKKYGWHGVIYETSRHVTANFLAKKAIASGHRHLIIAGGDGTVRQVIQEIAQKPVSLGIIPLGTGNIFSRNLKLPQTVPAAVRIAILGSPTRIDIACANGNYFALMAGFGLAVRMMSQTSPKRKKYFGIIAYIWTLIKNLHHRSRRYRLVLDDQTQINVKTKSILVANIGKSGAGLDLVPGAHPKSGDLKVGIIRSTNIFSLIHLFIAALRGKINQTPNYIYHTAKKVIVIPQKPRPYDCDGDKFPKTSKLTIKIIPRGLTVLLPP